MTSTFRFLLLKDVSDIFNDKENSFPVTFQTAQRLYAHSELLGLAFIRVVDHCLHKCSLDSRALSLPGADVLADWSLKCQTLAPTFRV